jgi:hypothetical protein
MTIITKRFRRLAIAGTIDGVAKTPLWLALGISIFALGIVYFLRVSLSCTDG